RRLAHQLTPLRTPVEKGLLPLYSPTALAHLHGAHLKTLLDDVNRLAPAAYLDDAPLFRIMYQTATQPRHAALFNSATQAWNYEFFLEALSPAYAAPSDSASGSTVVNEPTLLTKQRLEEDFGSVQTFFRDFEARAMGMFGSGWIWLVTDDQKQMRVLTTYNSGNPITLMLRNQNAVKDSLAYSKQRPVGAYVPILALNMWEHAYLRDYGLDRERYVKNFWQNVDWSVVHKRL
ncbi:manganese and iron superoxide dismutase, partial [Ramicandelaber brevisporus]